MFLKHLPTGDLVEVLDSGNLFDPFVRSLQGRFHAGEEMPEPMDFVKTELAFPSGESLPRCWMDPAYRIPIR